MVTYILILMIPITALVVGFFTLKGVQLGLRWQVEVKQEQKPTMDSPIQPMIEHKVKKEYEKELKEMQSTFDEYLNGPQESR